MKYYVYVISSSIRPYIYVGLTNDVERRFAEHNKGYNKTTKPYGPFVILLTEEYENRPHARVREKYLKSGIGKEWLKTLE